MHACVCEFVKQSSRWHDQRHNNANMGFQSSIESITTGWSVLWSGCTNALRVVSSVFARGGSVSRAAAQVTELSMDAAQHCGLKVASEHCCAAFDKQLSLSQQQHRTYKHLQNRNYRNTWYTEYPFGCSALITAQRYTVAFNWKIFTK